MSAMPTFEGAATAASHGIVAAAAGLSVTVITGSAKLGVLVGLATVILVYHAWRLGQ